MALSNELLGRRSTYTVAYCIKSTSDRTHTVGSSSTTKAFGTSLVNPSSTILIELRCVRAKRPRFAADFMSIVCKTCGMIYESSSDQTNGYHAITNLSVRTAQNGVECDIGRHIRWTL